MASMEMEQLVAAFAAMSGNDNANNLAAPPPAATQVQMEELVATFAATLSMSGNVDNLAAPPPAAAPNMSRDNQETTSTRGAEADDGEPGKEEEACVLRVRFPNGRVVCKSFGAGRPTAALYQYCRSVLLSGGPTARRGRAFRIVRLAGGASDEVRASVSTSFRDLGLHRCTVHVVPKP